MAHLLAIAGFESHYITKNQNFQMEIVNKSDFPIII